MPDKRNRVVDHEDWAEVADAVRAREPKARAALPEEVERTARAMGGRRDRQSPQHARLVSRGVAQRRVWPHAVVVLLPFLDDDLGFAERVERGSTDLASAHVDHDELRRVTEIQIRRIIGTTPGRRINPNMPHFTLLTLGQT